MVGNLHGFCVLLGSSLIDSAETALQENVGELIMSRVYKFLRATGNSVYFTPNPTGATLPGWVDAKWRRVSSVEDKKLSAEAKAKMSAQGYYRQPPAYKRKRKKR